MTDDTALATSWLQGLASRGITTRLVNGRIRHFPASAYKQLTDDEVITLRHHRAEIRDALRAGPPVQAAPPTTSEGVAPTPAPPPPPCRWCHQAPCIGRAHHAFDVLHLNDPAEIKRRAEDEADQYEAYQRGWPTQRMIDRAAEREVPETEEQKQQRAIRQSLGWETPGGTRKL